MHATYTNIHTYIHTYMIQTYTHTKNTRTHTTYMSMHAYRQDEGTEWHSVCHTLGIIYSIRTRPQFEYVTERDGMHKQHPAVTSQKRRHTTLAEDCRSSDSFAKRWDCFEPVGEVVCINHFSLSLLISLIFSLSAGCTRHCIIYQLYMQN